jgi:hypothetical protein
MRPYLEKTLSTKGMVEWLKVKDLRSTPITQKKKKKKSLQQAYSMWNIELLFCKNVLINFAFVQYHKKGSMQYHEAKLKK